MEKTEEKTEEKTNVETEQQKETDPEKRRRTIVKKLREIEVLKQRQSNQEVLNEAQLTKIGTELNLSSELDLLSEEKQ